MKQGRAGLTALAATSLPWDSRGRVIFSHGQDRADIEDGSAPRLSQDASRLPRHAVEQGLDLRIQTPMPCLPPLTTPSVDCDPEGESVGSWSPLPLGKGSGRDTLACGNSRERWSGYLPSQGRSNIHSALSPWVGKEKWLALAQLGLHGPVGEAQ